MIMILVNIGKYQGIGNEVSKKRLQGLILTLKPVVSSYLKVSVNQ